MKNQTYRKDCPKWRIYKIRFSEDDYVVIACRTKRTARKNTGGILYSHNHAFRSK